jgi:hypothetical protein
MTAGRRGGPLLLLAVLLVTLAACTTASAASPSPPLDSGIRGTVLLGPTCAVEPQASDLASAPPPGDPCMTPYAAELVILDLAQQEVARVRAGPDGRFEVRVAPGDYTVAPVPAGDPFPSASVQAVTVLPGSFTDVGIEYDTGVR